jgi:hypothetical protein
MALEGTHIRFALDLEQEYAIEDRRAFLAGTIYPDSRWISGVDRKKTHSDRFLRRDFADSEFKAGWQVHCICDKVQGAIFDEIMPKRKSEDREARWIRLSAAKMVQDISDIRQFELARHLPSLNHAEAPNREDIHAVRRFNRIIQETYQNGKHPRATEYHRLWTRVGLSDSMASRLVATMQNTLTDTVLVQEIEQVYDRMLASWKDTLF